jgi:hypothetical protein
MAYSYAYEIMLLSLPNALKLYLATITQMRISIPEKGSLQTVSLH